MRLEDLLPGYETYNWPIVQVAADSRVQVVGGELATPGDGLHSANSVQFADTGSWRKDRRASRRFSRHLVVGPR
jgi:hypothetical protein